jgi:hypothetical protein
MAHGAPPHAPSRASRRRGDARPLRRGPVRRPRAENPTCLVLGSRAQNQPACIRLKVKPRGAHARRRGWCPSSLPSALTCWPPLGTRGWPAGWGARSQSHPNMIGGAAGWEGAAAANNSARRALGHQDAQARGGACAIRVQKRGNGRAHARGRLARHVGPPSTCRCRMRPAEAAPVSARPARHARGANSSHV